MIARNVFTRIPFKSFYTKGAATKFAYFNTLYDTFYIGGYAWNKSKILVDLIIKLNTTHDLLPGVRSGVERLQNIRLLTVDLNVFGALPPRVWAEFPKLEVLTIALYPFPTIEDDELQRVERHPRVELMKPRRRSKFGKRAEWIFKSATESLQSVKKDLPQWKLPKIEVVVRGTGEEADDEIEEAWDYDEDEAEKENSGGDQGEDQGDGNSEGENENEDLEPQAQDTDFTYYEQLKARMSHEVSRDQIKLLKSKHLPSRTVSFVDAARTKKPAGTYYADSEFESGGEQFSAWKSDFDSDNDDDEWD
jgi:hypothetical protein